MTPDPSLKSRLKERFEGAGVSVSEKELEKLWIYFELLLKWQKKINLVSEGSLPDLMDRHFVDSGQILSLIPQNAKTLVDLGSGAGFPGMVVAILRPLQVTLIESNQKKCSFLREVSRQVEVPVNILSERIEGISDLKADVVTSRALANLETLFRFAKPFTHDQTCCIFHKGKRVEEELATAQESWSFSCEKVESVIQDHSEGKIIKITKLYKV